jgi:hypothetical protein
MLGFGLAGAASRDEYRSRTDYRTSESGTSSGVCGRNG